MTATSRVPRPRVAEEKISSRPPARGDLTPSQLADSAALQAAVTRANAGKKGRKRLSDQHFADTARKLGGPAHRQQWYRYRRGREAIPPLGQMIAAMVLDRQPQDIFPDFRATVLRQIRNCVELLALEMSETDRRALLSIIESWLDAKRSERDKLLRAVRTLFTETQR